MKFQVFVLLTLAIQSTNQTLFVLGPILNTIGRLFGINLNNSNSNSDSGRSSSSSISTNINTNTNSNIATAARNSRTSNKLNTILNAVRFIRPNSDKNSNSNFNLNQNLIRTNKNQDQEQDSTFVDEEDEDNQDDVENQDNTLNFNLRGRKNRSNGLQGRNINIFVVPTNQSATTRTSRISNIQDTTNQIQQTQTQQNETQQNDENILVQTLRQAQELPDVEVNGQKISAADFIKIVSNSDIYIDGKKASPELILKALRDEADAVLNGIKNSEVFIDGKKFTSGSIGDVTTGSIAQGQQQTQQNTDITEQTESQNSE